MSKLFFTTAIVVALIGCTKSKDNPITNSVGGACGIDVVGDYNTIVHNCQMESLNATGYNCDDSINSFLNKYPGINCTAEKSDPNSVDNQVVQVNESDIRELLSKP